MKISGLNTSCKFCGYKSTVVYFSKQNDAGTFTIIRCASCKSSFVWPRPEEEFISQFYSNESYQQLDIEDLDQLEEQYYPNANSDAERIIRRCLLFKTGYKFLDVGAGYGHYSRKAIEKGFEVYACEPNPNARKIFQQMNGFEPDSDMFDEEYALRLKEEIDVLLLSQVLEHVRDPNEIVKNINIALKFNAIAVIAVPHFGSALSKLQGKRDMYISPPSHINYFSKKGLIELFNRNGFKLKLIETATKVPRGRIKNIIKLPIVSEIAWLGLYGGLHFFDYFNLGMLINAYFEKSS